jgi:hypothetical protein
MWDILAKEIGIVTTISKNQAPDEGGAGEWESVVRCDCPKRFAETCFRSDSGRLFEKIKKK